MSKRERAVATGATALATAVALVAIGVGVASAAGQRQTGSNVFTATKPGAATGNSFHFEFKNPENPAQKPHTVNRIVVHSPAGTTYDFGVVPQCTASDAELQTMGDSACPADSKVGSGLAVSDTGSCRPLPPRATGSAGSPVYGAPQRGGGGPEQG